MEDIKKELPMGERREYNLRCKVKKIHQSYKEITDGRRHETDSVILLPILESSETSRFLITYLPDVSTVCLSCGNENLRIYAEKCNKCGSDKIVTDHTEVPSWIGHPVHSPCRLAVLRKNNYCSQHHLFVMNTGVEQDLLNMDGKYVNLTVLSTAEDEICDTAKTVNRTVKT